jgi:hypothetical protein
MPVPGRELSGEQAVFAGKVILLCEKKSFINLPQPAPVVAEDSPWPDNDEMERGKPGGSEVHRRGFSRRLQAV